MITRIQVRNYKSLRYVDVPMRPYHVLVGPNASGKSAFLDVLSFLHDFISEDLDTAIHKRTSNFFDLVWGRGETEKGFEIALEMQIPHRYINELDTKSLLRYELAIHFDEERNEYEPSDEKCFFIDSQLSRKCNFNYTIGIMTNSQSISVPYAIQNAWTFHGERTFEMNQGKYSTISGFPSIKNRSMLTTMSNHHYEPLFQWFVDLIKWNIAYFHFDPFVMRKECRPGSGAELKPDGSNLPWVVDDFKKKNPERFQEWIQHLQTALPDLDDIRAFVRPEDRNCFLMFKYKNGMELPSWSVSDGTLRLLALTLPAYLPDTKGIYLFEEPENGIHPQAIETVMDSMKSFYDGQVLITTHSPLVMSLVKPEDVLCFWNDPEKGTQIITGDNHPVLREWKKNKDTSLGVLFASGILDSEWGDDEGSACTGGL